MSEQLIEVVASALFRVGHPDLVWGIDASPNERRCALREAGTLIPMLREAGFEIIPTAKTYAIARENEGLMATLRSIADRQPGESTRLYAQFVVSQVSAALRAGSENGVLSGSHEPVRMAQGPFDGADT